jgi:hypothetical protein
MRTLFGKGTPAARAVLLALALGIAVAFVAVCADSAVVDLGGHLQGRPTAPAPDDRKLIVADLYLIIDTALALTMAVGALGARALGVHRATRNRPLSATARTFAVLHLPNMWLGIGFTMLMARLAGTPAAAGDYTRPRESLALGTTEAVMAGFCEEILVLAIPLAAAHASGLTRLRLRGLPVGRLLVGVVLVAARISYHLDYGLGALPLIPWAIASIWWFGRTRALLPLILAHTAYDIAVTIAPHNPVGFWTFISVLTVSATVAGATGHRRIARTGTRPGGAVILR